MKILPIIKYLILVLLLSFYSGYTQTRINSTKALVTLLSLANTTCDEIKWCAIDSKLDNPQNGCCSPCSCHKDCYTEINCCPDKKISELYQDEHFENVDDFILFLNKLDTNLTTTEKLNLTQDTKHTNAYNVKSHNLKCISTSALEFPLNRTRVKSYKMVATCSTLNRSSNIIKKCEGLNRNISYEYLKDIVPVQSRNTQVVYKNIYCLECSEEAGGEFEFWEIYYTRQNSVTSIVYNHVNSIDEIIYNTFKNVKERPWSQADIVFKPRNSSSIGLSQCQHIDIETCTNTSGETDLASTCASYVHPVYIPVNGRMTVFNNLACLACEKDVTKEEQTCAQFPNKGSLTFIGRLNLDMDFYGLKSPRLDYKRNELLSTRFSHECREGFIYDRYKGACRQVLCPCGMIIKDGQCQPIFIDMVGQRCAVHFTIKIGTPLASTDQRNELEEYLSNHFNETFQSKMYQILQIALYRSKTTSYLDGEYLVYILFSSMSDTTNVHRSLEIIDTFLGIRHIKHSQYSFKLQFSIPSEIEMIQNTAKDISRNVEYDRLYLKGEYTKYLYSRARYFRITQCSLCYRVEILIDDVTFLGGPTLQLKRNKKIIYIGLESHNYYLSQSKFITCLSDYDFEAYTPTPADDKSNLNYFPSSTNDQNIENEKGMYLLYSGAGLLLLIIIVAAIKRSRRQNPSEINRESNVQTVETAL